MCMWLDLYQYITGQNLIMPFETDLKVLSIRRTNKRKLTGILVYFSERLETRILIPINFETDFATIPKIIRFFIDNDSGVIRDAAVIHDYLYSTQSINFYPLIDKDDADLILMDGMKDLGASFITRYTVYYAVRLFGCLFYRKG